LIIGGAALPAVRVELKPDASYSNTASGWRNIRANLASANANSPKGANRGDGSITDLYQRQASHADDYKSLVVAYRNGAAVHLSDVAGCGGFGREPAQRRFFRTASRRCW